MKTQYYFYDHYDYSYSLKQSRQIVHRIHLPL
jgi:hypothetical protein